MIKGGDGMKKDKKQAERLELWKQRLTKAENAYAKVYEAFDERDAIYRGTHDLRDVTETTENDKAPKKTNHVWNIVAENIESEVDSTIPMPKVTARRKQHEHLARKIEHMIRNEIDRLPMEQLNDIAERTVPTQGGAIVLIEWDNTQRDHNRVGENVVSILHPKEFVPQPGVYTSVDDMDWLFLKLPQTKGFIRRRYGVDVSDEREEEPQARGADATNEEDMVTQYVALYKNDNGGIGKFSWVNETVLEDYEDYQARRMRRCKKCGALENAEALIMERATIDGTYPEEGQTQKKAKKGVCSYCGSKEWEDSQEDYEELYLPTAIGGSQAQALDPEGMERGELLGGAQQVIDEQGNVVLQATARVPYYKPDVYPVLLQKNISVFGQLFGESDVDKIKDQQNTINRMEQKIIDRLCAAGTKITLPNDVEIETNQKDGEVIRLKNAADKQMIDVYDFAGNLQYEMAYMAQVYEEARRVLGITDSFQGRSDTTAKSGVAKQFAAAQSAGRLESKRKLKQAMYQQLFERLFKNRLAYCDEPRPIVYKDEKGGTKYDSFDRHEFMEKDEAGEWHYITDFIFSCDESSGLASNRQQMWQEITAQLQAGAFGDPTNMQTLILYWTKMEQEHYPGAGQTKKYLEDLYQQQQQAQQQMQQMQQQMQQRALEDARQDAQLQAQQQEMKQMR